MREDPGTPTAHPSGSLHTVARIVLGALAATGGAVAALGAGVLLLVEPQVLVHRPVPVSPQTVVHANNSPAAVSDPTDPGGLVVVNRVDRPRFSAALHSSRDGGRTWRTADLPLPGGLDRPFVPDAAFGPDGTLYVVYVNLTGVGNVPDNLWLSTSQDGGRSLTAPVRVAGSLVFQPRIAVGADGTLHVTYLEASSVGAYRLTGPARIVAVRSRDGGRTFSDSVPVSDPGRPHVAAGVPVVVGDELHVLYMDLGGDVRDVQDLQGPVWPDPFALVATRSSDGGRGFAPGVTVDADVVPSERFLVFLPEYPAFTTGPSGELYAAWSDGRSGDEDVFLRRSHDRGLTWTEAVRVNEGGDDGTQDLPAVSVAQDGRVDVVFYDRQRDARDRWADVMLAFSHNGGSRFDEFRLSDEPVDTRLGATARPYHEPDLGNRLAVLSSDDEVFAFWTDPGRGDRITLTQDILAGRADLSGLSRGSASRLITIIAGGFAVVAWGARWALNRRVVEEDASTA